MGTCEESPDDSCPGGEEPTGSIVRTVSVFGCPCVLSLKHCVARSGHSGYVFVGWMDRETRVSE